MMTTLGATILFGLLMAAIALVGGFLLILHKEIYSRVLLPLVAFAAGALVGGALLHMIPSAVAKMGNVTALYTWLVAGFTLFYALEEFLHFHHSHTHVHNDFGVCNSEHDHQHPSKPESLRNEDVNIFENSIDDIEANRSEDMKSNVQLEETSADDTEIEEESDSGNNPAAHSNESLPLLIIIADAVHNFIGGMFVGASFVDSMQLGITAWVAALAHEIPQEFGDFAILVHGGWSARKALFLNFCSALTFPIGGLIAYALSGSFDVSFLIPFAAGNFLYIGSTDLIPEVKHHHGTKNNALHFASFTVGIGLMLGIRIAFVGW